MLTPPKIRDGRALLLLLLLGMSFRTIAATNCNTQVEIPIVQCNALIDLYNSTGGASWTDNATNNWNVTNTPCSWTGVTCSGGNVTQLNRNGKNLIGSISNTLINLSALTSLALDSNQLSGSLSTLPPALTTLNLGANQLSGSLPSFPSTLIDAYLQQNSFTGSIPALPSGLTTLYLNTNQLSGSIPTLPAGFKNLSAGNNQLTGSMPSLPSTLLDIALDNNQLTGSIPNLPSGLTYLSAGYNQLSGAIPSLPAGLTTLILRGNRLSGTIPALPTSLTTLNLAKNAFSGTLPSFASLTGLTSPNLDLSYNALTDTYPGETTLVPAKQATWKDTQTSAPTGITATVLSSASVKINWTPITYTGDGGYYQVKYATTSGGAYTNATSTTANKSATNYTVTGLSPNTTYYFVVETVTPAHDLQQNALISTSSSEVSATTASICTSTVTSTADDSTVGTLRYVISNLCPDGIVDFASSLANQTITLTDKITFTQNVTLKNTNASGLQISGGNNTRLFHINAGVTVTMDNLIVVGGNSLPTGAGGALVNYGTLNFTKGFCRNNSTPSDGGCMMNHSGATVNFISSVCDNNQATVYGGCVRNEGALMIQGSVLINNRVTAGGGGGAIFNTGTGSVDIKDSTIEKNSATSSGGAIFSNGGTVTVTRSTFSQNSATHYGGAIRNDAPLFVVSNSTFFDNTSSGSGALHNYAGAGTAIMSLINNTIAGNSSYGVMNNTNGTLHLKNNIIANNSSTDCSNGGTLATNLKNLIKDNSCSPALSGDPLLATGLSLNGAPTGYPLTLELLPSSPAINAGDAATCAASLINNVDARNFARPQGSACDLGAFEASLPTAPSAFRITTLSNTSLQLSWTDNSSNESGFKIERDGALLFTTASNINSYTDSTVACNKTYNYRLWAFNNVGDSPSATATFATSCATPVAGYQSQPVPDTTLDFGTTAINSLIQKTLTIQEIGDAALVINAVKISGTDAAVFTIVPPTASFFIPDGGTTYSLVLQCVPSKDTLLSAKLELTTNDPNYPTVTYPLSCTGVTDSVNLTLTTSGSGQIATCGQNCTQVYPKNTPAILTVTPAVGWLFSHWAGECSGSTNPLTITMDTAKTCQAVFVQQQRTLTLFRTKYGDVSGAPGLLCPTVSSCSGTYPEGEVLTLTATPLFGYSFVEWKGDCAATTSTITLTMNSDKSCTASFVMTASPVTLTLAAVGSGVIQGCGQSCNQTYFKDTAVNLIATPDPGWQFSRWSDECPNGQVVMTGDKSCTAYFIAASNAVTLTITTTGQGMVAGCGHSCTQAHVKDSTVNLTANPAIGWQLSGWSGDCMNGQVVMSAAKTCTANFTAPTTTPTTGIPTVAPISGTANGNMSNYNQTAIDLTIAPAGSVSGGILAGTVTNNGLIANVTIAPGATVTGGKFSGFNINRGTLTDITLSPYSEISGGFYAGIINNGGVILDPTILPNSTLYGGKIGGTVLNQGVLQDVTFLPETLILGGTLSGDMVGDASGYVIIGEANLTKIRLARACLTMTVQLGSNVQLDKTVIQHPPVPLIDAGVEDFCIQPEAIPYFTKQRILGTEKLAFQTFEAENVAELPLIALEVLIAEQLANFRADSLSALTVAQYQHIPLATFKGLHKDNLGGFNPQVMTQFDTPHFNELQGVEFQNMPGFGIAKWLTNLNKSQLTAELREKFIPKTWQLDETTGIFTAPADTQLAMKALQIKELPENVSLPAYQFDANTTFSLSGNADAETLLQKINRALQIQGVNYQAEQTQYGVILSHDAKNNRQFAFMLNSKKLLQRAETATVGAQLTETGEYQVLTVDDIEVNLSPAPKDPVAVAKTLGVQSQVAVGERGDVFLSQVAAKSRRVRDGDFVYVVTVFDPFIEPSFSDICHVNEVGETVCDWENAAAEMQPGLHFGDGARAKQQAKFIYPDGMAQMLYPTVFEPDTFIAEAKKFPGVEAVQFNTDGTFMVTYQGQKLQLFPKFAVTVTELEKYQHVKPSVKLTSAGVEYQVQRGQQLLTSELSFNQ